MLARMSGESVEPQFYLCRACAQPSANGLPPCDQCGSTIGLVPLENTNGLTLDDLARFGASSAELGTYFANVRTRWVKDFARRIGTLTSGPRPSEDTVAIFWVRLHGVVTELIEYLEKPAAMYDKLTLDEVAAYSLTHRHATSRLKGSKVALDGALAIRAALRPDEHVYADWQRQLQCHLAQNAFRVDIVDAKGDKRRMKDRSKLKATSELLTVEQRWAAIQRVLRAHLNDDVLVAMDIAGRIKAHSEQVAAAWLAFIEPAAPNGV